jgi:aminocarboxymuconate-semialdehyde decarboxylase
VSAWNKYGPTAARKHGRPGRKVRPKSITIDIHSHVAVPEAAAFVQPHLAEADLLQRFASSESQRINRQQDADRHARMSGRDGGFAERLRDLDAMGIDVQVVTPPPPQCYFTLPVEIAVKAARMVNEGIAAFVARNPKRYVGLGTVPLQDGKEAAAELEYGMKKLGFKGVEILSNVAGRELSDPAFLPFWKKAEELGAFIFLHPIGFTEGSRFSRFYFNNVIGNPLDTTLALHYLIFDGVLERHPKLKILAVHGGGYLAAYSGRIDHAWGARSDTRGKLPNPPTSYLKKIYFDTIVFTPHQLEYLVRVFGADHILMGTDYPFDMGEYDPVGHIAAVKSFDTKTKAALAGGNVKKLLGL